MSIIVIGLLLAALGDSALGAASFYPGLVYACAQSPRASAESAAAPASIQVEMLSRGRGVPEAARQTYYEIKTLAEGLRQTDPAVRISERLMGLEGERRMCIGLAAEQQAAEFFDQIDALARHIDLLNVSRGACSQGPR